MKSKDLIQCLPALAVLAHAVNAFATSIEPVGTALSTNPTYDVARVKASTNNEDRQASQRAWNVATLIDPKFATDNDKPESDAVISLLQKKEFDKALQLATTMVAANPNDPTGYNLQGTAYAGKKDLLNARRSFEKALALQPDHVRALFNIAQLDVQQKDFASARKRYQAIIDKDPKNILAMIGMADVEAADKKGQESLAWLQRAKSANPESITPRIALATFYLRGRNHAAALAELTEAERSHPNDVGLLDLLGQAQSANRQAAAAVTTYTKLVTLHPSLPLAHYRLAMAQVNNQNLSGATESLRKAVQLKPDFVEATDALAKLELRAGRRAEAVALARNLQKATPGSPAGLTLEGDLMLEQKRYPDALKAYEGAFALGQSGLLAVKLHVAQSRAGHQKEADAKLQRWLDEHPDDVGGWQYLARQNVKAGRDKLAIEQYQKVLQKAPDNALALSDLAILYQREKDPRALPTAQQAYKLVPDSPTTADALGWILVEQGETTKGLPLVQKAALQAPRNAQIRYHLAVALAKSGDKAKARKELESLLAGDGEFAEREAARRMLKQL